MDYKQKYLKYKSKYLYLKNQLGQSNSSEVIAESILNKPQKVTIDTINKYALPRIFNRFIESADPIYKDYLFNYKINKGIITLTITKLVPEFENLLGKTIELSESELKKYNLQNTKNKYKKSNNSKHLAYIYKSNVKTSEKVPGKFLKVDTYNVKILRDIIPLESINSAVSVVDTDLKLILNMFNIPLNDNYKNVGTEFVKSPNPKFAGYLFQNYYDFSGTNTFFKFIIKFEDDN